MPVCPICKTTFHACSNCGLNRSYEYEFCSVTCWRESSEYKKYHAEFKALYSTINDAQKNIIMDLLEMSSDYLNEISGWIKEAKQEEDKKYNMKYLKLNDKQYKMYEKYMQTVTNDWPKDLMDYIKIKHGKEPMCGDALSCLVADWIKESVVENEDKRSGPFSI